MNVRIQHKTLTNGRGRFYLDYTENGKRTAKMLPIYAQGEKESARAEAEKVRADFMAGHEVAKVDAFALMLAERKGTSKATATALRRVAEIWRENCRPCRLAEVTAADVKTFAAALQRLHNNTANYYLRWLAYAVTAAADAEKVGADAAAKIKAAIKAERRQAIAPQRGYLTPADVRQLFATPTPSNCSALVADAFRLAYYTGLRYSDVRALRAADIEGDHITLRQVKTKTVQTVYLNPQASEILQRNPRLFGSLPTATSYANYHLATWCRAAGVKVVTMHIARHTAATSLLNAGVPITTVSKMLGHKSITTTQIYAAVADKTQADAMRLL